MRFWFGCIILSCAVAQSALAQDVGHAMIKHPVASAEEFARAFESNDQSVLRATRQNFIDGVALTMPEEKNLTIANFPQFIRGLTVIPCPSGEGTLSRVLSPSGVIDFFWKRTFRPGEKCLFNNNSGRLVLSLYCGNLIMYPKSPTPETVAKIEKTQEVANVEAPPSVAQPVQGDSLNIKVIDGVIIATSNRFGIREATVTRDSTFGLGNSKVSIQVSQRPPSKALVSTTTKGGSFWTSKKLWIPLALVAGGTGGYFLGQERVKVVCGTCNSK